MIKKQNIIIIISLLFLILFSIVFYDFQNENKLKIFSKNEDKNITNKSENIIRVGTAITEPFSFYMNKELIGYDIDLINFIAEDNDYLIEIIEMPFANLIPSLRSEKIDIIIAAIHITEEREAIIDFSIPYLTTGLVMVANENNSNEMNSIYDLENKRVGVKIGATGHDFANELLASGIQFEIIEYKETINSLLDLGVGRVDVVFNDYLNSEFLIGTSFEDYQIIMNDENEVLFLNQVGFGIAVRKGGRGNIESNQSFFGKMEKAE